MKALRGSPCRLLRRASALQARIRSRAASWDWVGSRAGRSAAAAGRARTKAKPAARARRIIAATPVCGPPSCHHIELESIGADVCGPDHLAPAFAIFGDRATEAVGVVNNDLHAVLGHPSL